MTYIYNLQKYQSTVSVDLKGGLGNQMFKIFCLISYGIDNNKKFIINKYLPKHNISKLDLRTTYWDSIFKNIRNNIYDNTYDNICFENKYTEIKEFEYNKIPYFNNNISLYGYFQNAKYFENNYDLIIDILDLNKIQTYIKNKYLKNSNTISIHFRLGDYKNIKNTYIILNINYFKRCKNINIYYILYIIYFIYIIYIIYIIYNATNKNKCMVWIM